MLWRGNGEGMDYHGDYLMISVGKPRAQMGYRKVGCLFGTLKDASECLRQELEVNNSFSYTFNETPHRWKWPTPFLTHSTNQRPALGILQLQDPRHDL